jgi:hypothetical protein
MRYSLGLAIILTFAISPAKSQSRPLACKDIHNGQYYFHSRRIGDRYKIIRNGYTQTEINLTKKDTTRWKLTWLDDCTCTAEYISGGNKSIEEKLFLAKHKSIAQFLKVTPNYYITKMAFDSVKAKFSSIDTTWMRPR